MPVKVRVGAVLQRRLGGSKNVDAQGKTIREVLDDLDRRFPGFKGHIIAEGGQLHRFVSVFLNDEDILFLGELDTPVKDGDSITILPSVAGG